MVQYEHPSMVELPPRWQILAPGEVARADALALRLVPGRGFGDGRHPTTQLCLQAIAALAPRDRAWRLLDFGSGSGVLSIAGALLAATVDAVEIDAAAIEHAEQNLRANGVADRVHQRPDLGSATGPFDLVVANILRAVLLEFAPALARLHARGGTLVLSGLVSTDVPEVSVRYAALLGGVRPEVYEREDWRAVVWRG
jgi:ribosomal protein L11 methyltransferase